MLSPFRALKDFESEWRQLLGEAFGGSRVTSGASEWAPDIDVVIEDEEMKIRAELAGMKREDINVAFGSGVLTISGEREEKKERSEEGYLIRERRHGSFRRSIPLPEGVQEDDIRASFADGVLEVRVKAATPLTEGPRPIEVEGE